MVFGLATFMSLTFGSSGHDHKLKADRWQGSLKEEPTAGKTLQLLQKNPKQTRKLMVHTIIYVLIRAICFILIRFQIKS